MRKLVLTASLLAAVAGVSAPANAMSYSYRQVSVDTVVVDAKGEISPDEGKTLAAWVNTLPQNIKDRQHFAFVLDSPGGNPYGAYDVGEAIRKNGGNTGVAENGICASACVILWAAGVNKSASATSKIGVHGAYYDKGKLAAADAKNAPLLEATTTLDIARQLKLYGAPDNVVVKTIMTPSNDMYWLTTKDATDWGANVTPAATAPKAPPVEQASLAPPRPKQRPTQVDPPGLY